MDKSGMSYGDWRSESNRSEIQKLEKQVVALAERVEMLERIVERLAAGCRDAGVRH